MRITWGVVESKLVNFGVLTPMLQASEVFHDSGLPDKLDGKVVLELYSGDDELSVVRWVQAHGGRCLTVDSRELHLEPGHSMSKVQAKLEDMESDSVDYVVANGPPWWNGGKETDSKLDNIDMVIDVLRDSMRVVKNVSGRFVAFGHGFSEADASLIYDKLFDGESINKWIFEYGDSLIYKGQSNSVGGWVRIVRK